MKKLQPEMREEQVKQLTKRYRVLETPKLKKAVSDYNVVIGKHNAEIDLLEA